MGHINLLAVLVAAVSSFLLGGLWYSPKLFGAAWNRENGSTMKAGEGRHPARVFGISFVCSLIAALTFAYIFGPAADITEAAMTGLLVGLCFVAMSFGINYQFANRSTLIWMIDGGYHTVQFVLYGIIIGLWH
jgi:Protein of unknown function (DUF1761)